MRKFIVLGLALVLLSSALFADDALVMPARVGRFYLAPSFIFGTDTFNASGDRVLDISAMSGGIMEKKMFNLGAALEYGVNGWITGAIQWAPGFNLWSTIDNVFPEAAENDARLSDLGDLFVGAKMQLIGNPAAPAPNERMRLAIAPGVKIPLGKGPDFAEQFTNFQTTGNTDSLTVSTLDKHIFGLGLRSYFDIIINERFFVNFYNEVLAYTSDKDLKYTSFAEYARFMTVFGPVSTNVEANGTARYGYDLTFEIEPKFTTPVAERTIFTFGLPVRYVTSPGRKYTFTATGTGDTDAALTALQAAFPDGASSHIITLAPNISTFFMGWPIPMEFKLTYSMPLRGQNAVANSVIGFQIRLYFRTGSGD